MLATSTPRKLEEFYEPSTMEKLGVGASSIVRCYTCKATGVGRAVKTMVKREVLRDAGFQAMLKREMEFASVADHPNVIKLLETLEDEEHIHLVMQLCSGGELFDRVVQFSFITESQVAALSEQMFRAIAYLHNKCICHRDVKPEHFIFVDDTPLEHNPSLKLVDFGLSCHLRPGEVLRTAVGTLLYVAPEVLKQSYGSGCDVWSCGVVIYSLLCGYTPFNGDDRQQLARCVRKAHFSLDGPAWEPITGKAKELLRAVMLKDPYKRLSAFEVLEREWIVSHAPKSSGVDLELGRANLSKAVQESRRARSFIRRQGNSAMQSTTN